MHSCIVCICMDFVMASMTVDAVEPGPSAPPPQQPQCTPPQQQPQCTPVTDRMLEPALCCDALSICWWQPLWRLFGADRASSRQPNRALQWLVSPEDVVLLMLKSDAGFVALQRLQALAGTVGAATYSGHPIICRLSLTVQSSGCCVKSPQRLREVGVATPVLCRSIVSPAAWRGGLRPQRSRPGTARTARPCTSVSGGTRSPASPAVP